MDSSVLGYTGTGLLTRFRGEGQFVRWTVPSSRATTATLVFRYSSRNVTDRRRLEVNGVRTTVTFPRTTLWSDWRTVSVPVNLVAGTNTVQLTYVSAVGSTNTIYLDSLTVNT